MSDLSITPISVGLLPQFSDGSALRSYNQRGLVFGAGIGTVIDTVSLSAEAQLFINTTGTSFPGRADAISQWAQGLGGAFVDADYSGASFIGQDLSRAAFINAILIDANFTGASLRNAIFSASLVTGAQFNQADLTGADMTGAQGLTFTQIQGATFDASTQLPDGL